MANSAYFEKFQSKFFSNQPSSFFSIKERSKDVRKIEIKKLSWGKLDSSFDLWSTRGQVRMACMCETRNYECEK
jgi:hypothetical protein